MASAGSVTLPGSGGGTATIQAGSGDHVFVAQIIANTILLAQDAGTINPAVTVTINGAGAVVTPPPLDNGEQNILYLVGSGGGTYNIPAGYDYVVDLLTGPETITGSNVQVIAYDSSGSATKDNFQLSGNSSLAADPNANFTINLTGSFNEATGDGNNTVTAIGTGTVGGGTGSSLYTIVPTVGGAGIRLQSNGLNDTVNVISGSSATVISAGNNIDLTQNGLVTVDALLSGTGGHVQAGAGTMNVSLGGSGAQVLGG